jgi:hypothetical protein
MPGRAPAGVGELRPVGHGERGGVSRHAAGQQREQAQDESELNWSVPLTCSWLKPIFRDDGSIKTVVQTAVGTAGPEGPYETITGRNSGKVLDVRSRSTADGAGIIQWSSSALAANQHWFFRDAGNGYYNVVSRNTGKCLDVQSGSKADGAAVIQWTCTGGTNQQWSLTNVGNYVQLVARHSGKCLDVQSGSTADGAAIIQWTCTGATNQQWTRTTV